MCTYTSVDLLTQGSETRHSVSDVGSAFIGSGERCNSGHWRIKEMIDEEHLGIWIAI